MLFRLRGWMCVFTLLVGMAMAQSPVEKLAPELRGLSGSDEIDVVVRYKGASAPSVLSRVAGLGSIVKLRSDATNSALVRTSKSKLRALAEQLGIEYVSSDRVVRASLDYSAAATGAEAAYALGSRGDL